MYYSISMSSICRDAIFRSNDDGKDKNCSTLINQSSSETNITWTAGTEKDGGEYLSKERW